MIRIAQVSVYRLTQNNNLFAIGHFLDIDKIKYFIAIMENKDKMNNHGNLKLFL